MQSGEVYLDRGLSHLSAHCDGNVGRLQFLSPPIPQQFGSENVHQLWRGYRDMFSLPENLGVVAALQRCPTPRLLDGRRLRGLSIVHIC